MTLTEEQITRFDELTKSIDHGYLRLDSNGEITLDGHYTMHEVRAIVRAFVEVTGGN